MCDNVPSVESYLIDAAEMWEVAYKKLCGDSHYFVDIIPKV